MTKNWGSTEALAAGEPRAVQAPTPLGQASSDRPLDVSCSEQLLVLHLGASERTFSLLPPAGQPLPGKLWQSS